MNKFFALTIVAGLLLGCLSSDSFAADPDTFSPVVSYQYYDAVGSDTNTTIASPVISYQYFDWPGDSNLTFQTSSLVSYLFNGPPVILQQPQSQIAKVGTNVLFSVNANGSTPLGYQWRFNGGNLDGDSSDSISVTNIQFAKAGDYSVIIWNTFGVVTSSVARLHVYVSPLTTEPLPPPTAPSTELPPSSLTTRPRIPNNAEFVVLGNGIIDRNKMTIVLTHGWFSSKAEWPTDLANELIARGYGGIANIVAWNWSENANIPSVELAAALSASTSRTFAEGETLGSELLYVLGANYKMPIHFIGHSLGTLVNCRAADYIHGDSRSAAGKLIAGSGLKLDPNNTHITIFDEAELVSAVNGVYIVPDILFAPTSDTTANLINHFAVKVIPDHCTWIDNYVSGVGLLHSEAANILLWRECSINPIAPHSYACRFYKSTVTTPTASLMGHRWSFERNTMSSSAKPSANTYFLQSLDLDKSESVLTEISPAIAAGMAGGYGVGLNRLVVYPTLKAYQGLSALGNFTLGAYLQGIQVAGNLVIGFAEAFTPISGDPVYVGTANSTPAYFVPSGTAPTYQADWDLQFTLQSHGIIQSLQKIQSGNVSVTDAGVSSNSVYTWIPVSVPSEAVGITFQYRLEGAGTNEFFNMGISNVNYYAIEAKYLEDGAWQSSGLIQIPEYSGQDIQLFFSLNGDVPPVGKLSVRGIQFMIPPRPNLAIVVTNNQPVLSWPVSALGWQLESLDSMTETNWMALTNSPAVKDYQRTVTDENIPGPRFYRLRK